MNAPYAGATNAGHHQSFWLWVMCLTGVDYFSTLGYQPSIAYENAGLLAPLATVVLVARHPVRRPAGLLPTSPAGRTPARGPSACSPALVSGWRGKILVLVLLGFAATDFVITKTLSAADAAVHLIRTRTGRSPPADERPRTRQAIVVTVVPAGAARGVFLRGFREVIGLAVVIVGVYLVLNAVVIGAGRRTTSSSTRTCFDALARPASAPASGTWSTPPARRRRRGWSRSSPSA